MKHLTARFLAISLVSLSGAAIAQQDPYASAYAESCAACHGPNLEGAPQGTRLVGSALRHGDTVDAIERNIAQGFPQGGMPAWSATMDPVKIRRLAIYVSEQRANLAYSDFKVATPPTIPEGTIKTEAHSFRIETLISGLDPLPYSIAPLPDGSLLLTEKTRGMSIVSATGQRSELIRGAPKAYDDGMEIQGILLVFGQGYLLDVALHPDYEKNGWIYLTYTDRCSDCTAMSKVAKRPASMVAVVRGRIKNGEWIDQQPIWNTSLEHYSVAPDMAAGGRLAFDGNGHVFFSIGIKGMSEFAGIQDLAVPYGKIYRVNEDGSIPTDNPFVGTAGALPSIWSYGHRSPQGLEFNSKTRQLWETEMGQRGGDEVNLLLPGKNYGWPLYSKGLKYDGTPVDYGKQLGLEADMRSIQQPIVDLTPSPAVSSFAFYDGAAFKQWQGNLIVGTLKATELYRMVLEGERIVHTETLLKGVGRIRDVEVGVDGSVYLLTEHQSGGKILKLVREK
jgi:glucose/arabinose dehydrogenase